jgi:hypothetical protein
MIIYPLTIFISAFLLFLVQPIIGKQILPWFGGSAGVWSICLVFFQVVLLAGYAYSDWLSKKHKKKQAIIHAAILIIGLASLPILANPALKPTGIEDPSVKILWLLLTTIGLPYFLLSTTGPLIQKWFSVAYHSAGSVKQESVYRLFALSNLASLISLLLYPFIVEPYFTIQLQSGIWSMLFIFFTASYTYCACKTLYATPVTLISNSRTFESPPAPRVYDKLLWLAFSALSVVVLLAVTTHITQNIAPIPFLWILPLTLYLLSFIFCFDSTRWYKQWLFYPLILVCLPLMTWGLFVNEAILPFHLAVLLYLGSFFIICMFCHGELAIRKPSSYYLTRFYFFVSLGGALGGLSVGLFAPYIFNNYWELPIAFLILTAMLWWITTPNLRIRSLLIGNTFLISTNFILVIDVAAFSTRLILIGLLGFSLLVIAYWLCSRRLLAVAGVAALICASLCMVLGLAYRDVLEKDTVDMKRNFFGTVRVKQYLDTKSRRLYHGNIVHGEQFIDTPASAIPTTYFGESSGVGIAIAALRKHLSRPLRVGIIGLGTGTIAAYGIPSDYFRFYEINPDIIEIAKKDFSYLVNSQAKIDLVLGDARLQLEKEEGNHFDLLVVDAFSGDSIPVHLITNEAMNIYTRHIDSKGIIAFHTSNRYLNLPPIVAQIGTKHNMVAVAVLDDPVEKYLRKSQYVLLSKNTSLINNLSKIDKILINSDIPIWTDSYNNIFKILKY